MNRFLYLIILFLPAFLGNGAPVIAKLIKPLQFLFYPIDGNRLYQGSPIFGSHKTWLGLISACLTGFLTALLVYPFFDVPYSPVFGFIMGFTSIAGDMAKSFFKRRLGLKPGQPWIPFDQLDYIAANIMIFSLFIPLNLLDVIFLLALGFTTATATSLVSWTLGIKDKVF